MLLVTLKIDEVRRMSSNIHTEPALGYGLPFEPAYDDRTEVIYDSHKESEDADIELPHLYQPRSYQAEESAIFFESEITRFIRVWHRRAGKDKDAWNLMITACMLDVGQYYYLLPTTAHARRAIYENIDNEGMRFIDHIPDEMVLSHDKGEMMWEFINGSILRLGGSDNFDAMVGANIKGIVFSEWSLCNPMAWDYFEPMLEMNGGWAMFVYTARGRNHGWTLLEMALDNPESWHASVLTIEDTGLMTRERYEQKLKETLDEDKLRQEWYCDFNAAMAGAYFAKIMEKVRGLGRYFPFPVEQKLQCITYWDIGKNDMMSITIVQCIGDEGRIVQYFEDNNEDFNYYIDWLNRWREYHGVTFQEHWAPHDIEVREFTGKGLKTRKELAREAGIRFITRERISNKNEGISLIRQLLPKLYFRKTYGEPQTAHISRTAPIYSKKDPSGCEHLWNCLSNYHQAYDEKRQVFKDHPEHDWSSHAVDSIQNMAQWWKERSKPKQQPKQGRQIKRKIF